MAEFKKPKVERSKFMMPQLINSRMPGGPLLAEETQFSFEEWKRYYLLAKKDDESPITFIRKNGLKQGIASLMATKEDKTRLLYSRLAMCIYFNEEAQLKFLPEGLQAAIIKYCRILKIHFDRTIPGHKEQSTRLRRK